MQHEETIKDLMNVRRCLLEHATHSDFNEADIENLIKAFAFIDSNIARLKATPTPEKSDK
jgi:hypothetical protein